MVLFASLPRAHRRSLLATFWVARSCCGLPTSTRHWPCSRKQKSWTRGKHDGHTRRRHPPLLVLALPVLVLPVPVLVLLVLLVLVLLVPLLVPMMVPVLVLVLLLVLPPLPSLHPLTLPSPTASRVLAEAPAPALHPPLWRRWSQATTRVPHGQRAYLLHCHARCCR